MATCYNIIYNTSTSAFQKHGGTVLSSGIHSCGFYVDVSEPNNTLFNTSADNIVIVSNTNLSNVLTSASQVTSGDINTDNTLQEVGTMKVTLNIIVKNPIVKAVYSPLSKTQKDDVVRRY
jgi:hypothetical protein